MVEKLEILKNKEKFKQIKLAKGLDLKQYSLEPRENIHRLGISSKPYGSKWFVLPKGRGIFKTYDGDKDFDVIRKQRIINERLCYILAKQVGIPCAEYEPANIDGVNGLITYDITNEDEIIMTLKEWEIKNCFESIYEENFVFDLLKMVVFDTLTMQSDRHNDNVHVIYNKKTKSVRVSPLIDNEMAFCAKILALSYDGRTDETTFFNAYSEKAFYFIIHNENSPGINKFEKNVTKIAKIAEKDKKFKNLVESYINNMDIKKAIKQVEEDGYIIHSFYKEYICKVHDYAKQMLIEKLNTVKKEDIHKL